MLFEDSADMAEQDDLSADGWKRHLEHRAAKAPLSEKEQDAKLAKDLEGLRTEGTSTRNADVHGSITGMPWSDDAQAAVSSFASSETKVLYLVSTRSGSSPLEAQAYQCPGSLSTFLTRPSHCVTKATRCSFHPASQPMRSIALRPAL